MEENRLDTSTGYLLCRTTTKNRTVLWHHQVRRTIPIIPLACWFEEFTRNIVLDHQIVRVALAMQNVASKNRICRSKLHPGKLIWHWKTNHLKMYLLLKMVIFHCHHSFRGDTQFSSVDTIGIEASGWPIEPKLAWHTTLAHGSCEIWPAPKQHNKPQLTKGGLAWLLWLHKSWKHWTSSRCLDANWVLNFAFHWHQNAKRQNMHHRIQVWTNWFSVPAKLPQR